MKDNAIPLFFGFLIFSFRPLFFQDFVVALHEILALPRHDIKWCDINSLDYPNILGQP